MQEGVLKFHKKILISLIGKSQYNYIVLIQGNSASHIIMKHVPILQHVHFILILKYNRKLNIHVCDKKQQPLSVPQVLLIPLRFNATLESSANDSVTLKSHRGLTSKKAMSFFRAQDSAICSLTCRLYAMCSRFPTNILGTPGACYKVQTTNQSSPKSDSIFHFY